MSAVADRREAHRGQRRWLLMAVPAVFVALFFAGPYVVFSYSRIGLNPSHPSHVLFLSLHALSAGTALLIGPLQFIRRIRADHPRVHRTIGTVYLLAVLIGGIMSLISAVLSTSGWSAAVGFVVLAVFWLFTAYRALQAVLARQYAEHRIWMIRNYSATFAAVLLRVILTVETAVLPLVGVDLARSAAYDVAVWGSFTISIFVAELFIVQRSIVAVLPVALIGSVPTAVGALEPRTRPEAGP